MSIFKKGSLLWEKYCLLEELGHGGSGRVFLAVDVILQKRWAVKLFRRSEKTADEIRILKELDHPMIPRIVEYIEGEDYTGVVMDYLDGIDLGTICKNGRTFSVRQTLKFGIAICEILEYLHTHDPPILYRDMKPQNLMLTRDGSLKLIDFDCACFLADQEHTAFAGTRGYAAPEQYGGSCSPATDIFALGVTLEVISRKRKPARFRKILKKCRNPKPQKRYQSARQLSKKLKKCLKKSLDQRRGWKLAVASALLLLLLPLLQLIVLTGSEAACMEAIQQKNYEKAVSLFPEREEIYIGILQDGIAQGTTEEAIQMIGGLQQMYPEETKNHGDIRMRIGRLYIQGNPLDESFSVDYEKARRWYQEISEEQYPEAAWSLELLDILTQKGDQIGWEAAADSLQCLYQEAQKETDSINRSNICEILASVWMTNRYYLKTETEEPLKESIQLLEEGISLIQEQESRKSIHMISLKISLAQAYYLYGIFESDEDALKTCLELYQQIENQTVVTKGMNRRILQRMAYVHEELGTFETAAQVYQRLIAEYPGDLENLCSYALLELIHRGNVEKAEELFEKAGKLPDADKNQNYLILKERLEGTK